MKKLDNLAIVEMLASKNHKKQKKIIMETTMLTKSKSKEISV
jgi:hypothetical protein